MHSPHQPEHLPGHTIQGRYKIIRFISRGGFGETYEAEDMKTPGLICLLKYLKPVQDIPSVLEVAKKKFEQEADILKRLGNHNQIPTLYDYFEEQQRFYLVEEYIDGQNLSDELQTKLKTQLFSEKEVIEILYDVLNVLDYLHRNKVIHRDIKPANLIRRKCDSKIVLVDFGAVKEASRVVVNAHGETFFSATIPIGTPRYMPCEQEEGRPEYASDIYALGITGFQLLTGHIPTRNNKEINWNGVQISQYLKKILDKMMSYERKKRYQSVRQVLDALDTLNALNALNSLKNWFWRIFIKYLPVLAILSVASIGLTYFIHTRSQDPLVKARNFFDQCLELTEKREYETASKVCEQAFTWNPNLPEALVYKGIALTSQGQLKNTKGDRQSANALFESAIIAYDRAIAISQTRYALSPTHYTEAWVGQGNTYAYLGNYEESVRCCLTATKIAPDNHKGWLCLGTAQLDLKKYDNSIKSFEKTIELACNSQASNDKDSVKDCVVAFNNKGDSFLSKSKLLNSKQNEADEAIDKAINAYEQAIQKSIDNKIDKEISHIPRTSIGNALISKRPPQFEKALKAFEEALQVNKNYEPAQKGKQNAIARLKQQPSTQD
ncbi:protein kinase [Scytonema sp. UIC 10036]|uniref:serine/threonine-protein kinase n=1 Tax=Scytonema sp. UIC 10036 TaxID=2304196 RepID=UPI0012DAD6AD|nr:serine/threonine-protein kinase [Scytonema sp. UIC 10036]MUG92182.1 protein kinase [Scytonema sp. UIC 10036]